MEKGLWEWIGCRAETVQRLEHLLRRGFEVAFDGVGRGADVLRGAGRPSGLPTRVWFGIDGPGLALGTVCRLLVLVLLPGPGVALTVDWGLRLLSGFRVAFGSVSATGLGKVLGLGLDSALSAFFLIIREVFGVRLLGAARSGSTGSLAWLLAFGPGLVIEVDGLRVKPASLVYSVVAYEKRRVMGNGTLQAPVHLSVWMV